MPTVLRIRGYRFHFYSHESQEPPHIHVERGEAEAKLWLDPMSVAANEGFAAHELQKILELVNEHCQKFRQSYLEFHGLRTFHHRQKRDR